MKEIVRKLAEASEWKISEERLDEIVQMYKATMDDTRPVRELELGSALPAHFATNADPVR